MELAVLRIRGAVAGDAAALAGLMERTFRDTYAADSDPATLERHVAERFGVTQQRQEIGEPGAVTLLAELGGELVAFAQLRSGEPPACVAARRPVELRRFYVDQRWHGRGLAPRLMGACVDAAAGGDAIWLLVYRRNARAIAFYARHGFTTAGTAPYRFADEVHDDLVMVRPL